MHSETIRSSGKRTSGTGKSMRSWRPSIAFVLAAGLGLRMRPITATRPKPLVKLAGKPLIDHVLDQLAAAQVERAFVNVHYLADQMIAHLATRAQPRVEIVDEREALLETGGGVARVLDRLGHEPFFICNSDTASFGGTGTNLQRMAAAWDGDRMDCLMLLAPAASAIGYDGAGDFQMTSDGMLRRRREKEVAPFVYSGTLIAHPRLFANAPTGAFSLNVLWDRAIEAGRLFGIRQDGLWMHIGSPAALADAERRIEHGEDYF
jgi:N-acetyl-alpha-D-muramate 1-phosphate uridylyltransferase